MTVSHPAMRRCPRRAGARMALARGDPAARDGWQRLIHTVAGGGNRAEALRAYAQCKKLLADELGVGPRPETEAIVKGLRAGVSNLWH